MFMQLRTAAFCAALPKAGSNVIKIHGKMRQRHRRNKQQSMTAKYVSVQPNVHQVLGHRLLLLELHRKVTQEKMKGSIDIFFCWADEFVV
jgi:hypothetical protein